MRKLLFVLMSLFAITAFTSCASQGEPETKDYKRIDQKEIYQVKKTECITTDVEVSVDQKAVEYADYFSQAVSKPDTPVLVKDDKRFKLKSPFKKIVKTEKGFIIYNEIDNNISFFEEVETREESSCLILLSIIPILLMIILNILSKKGHIDFKEERTTLVYMLFFILTIIAVLVAFLATSLAAPFSMSLCPFFAVATCPFIFFTNIAKGKCYKKFSIIFYILMAIHIVLLFV